MIEDVVERALSATKGKWGDLERQKYLGCDGMLKDEKVSPRARIMAREPIQKVCTKCGSEYYSKARPQFICDECVRKIDQKRCGPSEVHRYEVPALYREHGLHMSIEQKLAAHRLIMLFGTIGTGKTSAAHNALAKFSGRKSQARFVTCSQLATEMHEDSKSILNAKILAVDDLGRHMSDACIEAACRIADHRVANQMLTIFTSNVPIDGYTGNECLRLKSRLSEFEWLRLGGEDKRGGKI